MCSSDLGKLDNPNFTAKAPEAVVAKEREKAVELSARLQKNSESINRMCPARAGA